MCITVPSGGASGFERRHRSRFVYKNIYQKYHVRYFVVTQRECKQSRKRFDRATTSARYPPHSFHTYNLPYVHYKSYIIHSAIKSFFPTTFSHCMYEIQPFHMHTTDNCGLLFMWPSERQVHIKLSKNVTQPLDIVHISRDHRVLEVKASAYWCSSVSMTTNVLFTLIMKAGTAGDMHVGSTAEFRV